MAKAKEKFELDDFGFETDSSLDMPGFEDFEPKEKKDRNPVISAVKAVGRGAVNTAKSPSFIKKLVLSALPKGYGDASKLLDETTTGLGSLYNTTVSDLNPTINEIKRATKKFLPKVETKLPKGILGKVSGWANSAEEKMKYASPEDQREVGIGLQIGNIFAEQAKLENDRSNESKAREVIRDGVELARHNDNISQLDAIRIGVSQIASYKQKIDSGFQRKSLELQYRHYFVAQDMLTQQRKTHDLLNATLTDVVKNTGLPDFVKLTKSESMKQIMRNRFMDSINDSIFSKRDAFVKNLISKLGSSIKEKTGQFKDAVATGLDVGSMVGDMADMTEGSGVSKTDMAGEFVGGMGLDYAGEWLGKKLGKGMSKIVPKNIQRKIGKYGNKLEYGVGNISQLATDWSRTTTNIPGSDEMGVKGILPNMLGGAIDILKDTIRSTNGVESGLDLDKAGSLTEPDVIRKSTNKSINEIIPGFLSRILREIQVLRTGDESIDLINYDYTTNKFADKKTVMSNMVASILGKSSNDVFTSKAANKKELDKLLKVRNPNNKQKERIELLQKMLSDTGFGARSQANDLVKKLDPNGDKLTEEQRDILAQIMVEDNLNNKSGSFKRLSDKKSYKGIAEPHADVFAKLFGDKAKLDRNYKQQLEFAKAFSDLGRYNRDSRKEVQDYANLGNTNLLEELGLVNSERGSINMEKLREYLYKDGDTAEMASSGIITPEPQATVTNINTKKRITPNSNISYNYDASSIHSEIPTYASTKSANDTVFVKIGEDIVNEIRDTSSKSATEIINETLLRIEKKLSDGINTTASNNSHDKESQESNRGFFNRAFGSVGTGAARLVGKGASVAYKLGKSMGDSIIGTMGFGIKTAAKIASFGITAGTDHLFGYKDIYVPGESLPRMPKWKMKAGHYVNQETGKVINSYKDITGNIIDITDPDNIVLSAEEIKTAFIKHNRAIRLITDIAGGGIKLAKIGLGVLGNTIGTIGNLIPPAVRLAINSTKATLRLGVGLIYKPEDVYVRGKDNPALLAMLMKAGGYFSKQTGKIIKSPADIDGPVLDMDGNVVLSIDDIRAGLLNKHGNPLRVGVGKITGMIKDVVSVGNRLVRKGINTTAKIVTTATNVASNFLMHGIDGLRSRPKDVGVVGSDRKLSNDDLVIKRLTEIRNLIDSRLPQQKKVRKGSYEDLMAQKKTFVENKTDDNTQTTNGLTGKLLKGGLGALAGLFSKKDKKDKEDDSFLEGAAESAAGTAALGVLGKTKNLIGKGLKYGAKGLGSLKNLGATGLRAIGTNGSLLSGATKVAAPIAAGMSVYNGVSDLSNGKEVDSFGKVVPKGFLNKINPLEWAMNGGMYAGNKINNTLNALVSLLAGEETSLGGLAFDGVEKLKKLFGNNDTTLKDANSTKLNINKPTAPIKKSTTITDLAKSLDTSKAPVYGITKANYLSSTVNIPTDLTMVVETNVDALSAIRYKSYGLKKLESDKIRALINLENNINKNLDYSNTDVTWNGDVKNLCSDVGGLFGIADPESEQGAEWSKWFMKRFLPIYLKYVSYITTISKKKDPATALSVLNGQQKYDAATAIYTVKDIWDVTYQPWLNYNVNTDYSSVNGNLESLKKDIKNVALKEKTSVDTGLTNKSTPPIAPGVEKKSFIGDALSKVTDTISKGWDTVKNTARSIGESAVDKAGQLATGVGKVAGAAKDIAINAGSAVASGVGKAVTAASNTFKGMADAVRAAKSSEAKYGIPAAVTLAQFSLESANGTRMPPGSNNPFGIKAKPGQPYSEAMTTEVLGGRAVRIPQKFAAFPSLDEAFEAHAQLLARAPVYANARANANDPSKFADALAGKYATDPMYGTKLKSIMAKQSGLLATDTIANDPKTSASPSGAINTANATQPPNNNTNVATTTPVAAPATPAVSLPDKSINMAGGIQLVSTTIPSKDTITPKNVVNSNITSSGIGFAPNKIFDSSEQQKYQRDLSSEALKVTNDTLKNMLTVDQDQLVVLKKMLELMLSGKGSLVSNDAKINDTQVNENNKPEGLSKLQSGEVRKAPISMRRTM